MKTVLTIMGLSISLLVALAGAQEKQKPTLPLPDSGNVTLTLDEYNKLVELAGRPPQKPEVAPLPYSIQHADIKLGVEDNGVLGTIALEGEVFHKGLSKVPLTSGMTILDAHQNGKGIPLIQENGTHAALLAGPADFSISLNTGLPLRIDAGRASFTLPAPSAGSVQLELVVPGDHTVANISPGLITNRKSESGHTAITATLVPGQATTVWWATREVVAPVVPREVRFLSDTKTLVSVSEAEMRVAVLADLTILQGEPSQFQIHLPQGYEVTGVTGATLDSTETQNGILSLKVNAPSQKGHQFLISMDRSLSGTKVDAPFLGFDRAQREDGEVLVEGAGTMEITATEGGGLKRMDVKEANPYLRSMAHFPPQAAFRYHRQGNGTPTLALDWVRFPDGSVLGAVAESAHVTTLVTSEGKSLTEVKLTLKNQAQPFLKVALPAGATIVSAEVAGERVKPVQGPDGNRVPLLRPQFRPTGAYTVSFVFMHSGTPFAKKGGADLSLPSMDIPISVLNWEVFLPDRYKVKDFGGDVIAASLVPSGFRDEGPESTGALSIPPAMPRKEAPIEMQTLPGQLGGYVTDPSGAVIANARVTVTSADDGLRRSTTTDSTGRWIIPGMQSGSYKARAEMAGFNTTQLNLNYDATQPALYNLTLNLGAAAETVEVSAEMSTAASSTLLVNGRNLQRQQLAPGAVGQNASVNVLNLQKRVAGVLPVVIEVPRAGTMFSFVRPLVLDEETRVTFSYKSR
jgi:Carboxypeptidase regulatory-like domain